MKRFFKAIFSAIRLVREHDKCIKILDLKTSPDEYLENYYQRFSYLPYRTYSRGYHDNEIVNALNKITELFSVANDYNVKYKP